MLSVKDVEWTREKNADGTWLVHGKVGEYDATRSGYSRRQTEALVLDALRGAVPYGGDTAGTSSPDLLVCDDATKTLSKGTWERAWMGFKFVPYDDVIKENIMGIDWAREAVKCDDKPYRQARKGEYDGSDRVEGLCMNGPMHGMPLDAPEKAEIGFSDLYGEYVWDGKNWVWEE